MTYPISHAVPSYYVATFREYKILTTRRLLKRAAKRAGREYVAKQLGIPSADILDAVNAAHLMEIKDIGAKQVVALRTAGVRTARQLAHNRNADSLARALAEIHTSSDPRAVSNYSVRRVTKWIECARALELLVTY